MQEKTHSGNRPISAICNDKKEKWEGDPFLSSGQKAANDRAPIDCDDRDLCDKRTHLHEAVGRYLKDGISLGIGGFINTRIPTAIIHEIIRQGARDLTLCLLSNSLPCELLAGAMILDPHHFSIRRIELSWCGYEIYGNAPLFRYLIINKLVELDEYPGEAMAARFKAGAMGLPFLPARDPNGGDRKLTNASQTTQCPFSDETLHLVPACHPDLGIIHVQAADMDGNGRIFGELCSCPDLAQAAVHTIMSTEQVIPHSSIRNHPYLTAIPSCAIDAVIDQPFGATPGACYGNYWFDLHHIQEFRDICLDFLKTGSKVRLRSYYNRNIFDVEHFDDMLEQKPYPVLKELCEQDGDKSIILD